MLHLGSEEGLCRLCRSGPPSASGVVSGTAPPHEKTAPEESEDLEEALYSCHPTLRHVPRGATREVAALLSSLLERVVETRSKRDMLHLLLMPCTVLAPCPRGGRSHAKDLAKIVLSRVQKWHKGERSIKGEPVASRRRLRGASWML